MAVVTSEFHPEAKFLAKARGYPNLPMVVLPHPFETLPRETILKLADEKFGEIVEALVTNPPAPIRT